MAIASGINGVGQALVMPAIFSLAADCSDDATRGSAFGWVFMVLGVGSVMGGSLGVLLAPVTFLGVPGWRLAFFAATLLGVSLATAMAWLIILLSSSDPRPSSHNTGTGWGVGAAAALVREATDVMSVPTFWIVVAQGVAATVPWSALTFAAMWLELMGFTRWETTVITGLNYLGNALGPLFAGLAGDAAARRFPGAGRIALAQVLNASAIPMAGVLLLALSGDDPAAGTMYAAAFFGLGFAMSCSAVSTNTPIFAEIVPEKARTTVYALDMCFESVLASFGAPIVGILAERVFGYQQQQASPGGSGEADLQNAAALGKAVFAEIAVPTAICCLTYTTLYWTYPADRQRARMAAARQESLHESEREAIGAAVATPARDGLDQPLLHAEIC